MTTMNRTIHSTTGVFAGLAIAALLAACGGGSQPDRVASTTNAAGSKPPIESPATPGPVSPGDGVVPAVSTVPSGPTAPPTVEETRAAWKEGVALYDSRDYDAATGRLQIAAIGRPDDAGVHYLLGLALWKSGHLEEAESALVRASSLDGASIRAWINLARVRMARDDARGALDASDEALTLDPGSADALHQRGRALEGMGRNDEALQTLEQARAAAPDNGWIANTLGHLLLIRGRLDEAIPHLEAACDRLPQVPFVRNNLGVAYERKGDLERAVLEYRAAVEAGDPDGKASASLDRLQPLVGPVVAEGDAPEDQASPAPGDGDQGSSRH